MSKIKKNQSYNLNMVDLVESSMPQINNKSFGGCSTKQNSRKNTKLNNVLLVISLVCSISSLILCFL